MDLTKEYISSLLPKRPKDANKGTFGKVLVIAGSENYPGAAYLVCAACYRVGAGLVTLAAAPSVKVIVSRKLPEVIFISFDEIFDRLNDYDVLLLGPGLGQSSSTAALAKKLLEHKLPNTIIDGDGLNILSKMEKWWGNIKRELVLTPHPGEMARLTGLTIEQIQSDRENVVKEYARVWNQVIVLKGANTVIASPGGKVAISPFANPALATAGTGDVLSGIIAGLLAQGLSNFDAACVGVYIHGMAGEMLREKFGESGGLASGLLSYITSLIKGLRN